MKSGAGRHDRVHLGRVVLAVLAMLAAPLAALAADSAPKQAAASAQRPVAAIDGFRSARFGMDETAVKKAIVTDFAIKDDKVRRDLHPTEKTTVLTIGAENLLPDTGPGIVSYILGFTSQKLTQVNVMWPQSPGANLASAAMVLRNHFLAQEFRSDSVMANAQLSDGTRNVTPAQLGMLLEGIDWRMPIRTWKPVSLYRHIRRESSQNEGLALVGICF